MASFQHLQPRQTAAWKTGMIGIFFYNPRGVLTVTGESLARWVPLPQREKV